MEVCEHKRINLTANSFGGQFALRSHTQLALDLFSQPIRYCIIFLYLYHYLPIFATGTIFISMKSAQNGEFNVSKLNMAPIRKQLMRIPRKRKSSRQSICPGKFLVREFL